MFRWSVFVLIYFLTETEGFTESNHNFSTGYIRTDYDSNPPGSHKKGFIKISPHDLTDSVIFAKGIIDRLERLEASLGWSNIKLENDTPQYSIFKESTPNIKALEHGKTALVAIQASEQLMHKYCRRYRLSKNDCINHLSKYSLNETPLIKACQDKSRICSIEEITSKFRSIDGSCNHVNYAVRGESGTSYKRLAYPDYMDSIQQTRRSLQKTNLPSPRKISSTLIKNATQADERYTLNVMQWGQFVAHDMAHTVTINMVHSKQKITCCDTRGANLMPRYVHPFCMPISIPEDDDYYSDKSVDCLSYVRSVPVIKNECTFGPLEQLNQATHFLDGSHLYGSTYDLSLELREMTNGLLKYSEKDLEMYMPVLHGIEENTEKEYFKTADPRTNSQLLLTIIHTIFLREHNRIATELKRLNPDWTDELLYQEARRIVVAEIQHVTYNEWLPIILGPEYTQKMSDQISRDFSEYIDPDVSNSFATAAMRFSKSLLDGTITLYNRNGDANITLDLKDTYNKPYLAQNKGYFDQLLRALTTQNSQKMDLNLPDDVTNHLFTDGNFGMDVVSLDIQRGRDHGLPSYATYRKLCGLTKVDKFLDLNKEIPTNVISLLSKVYKDVRDIDLLIGGMSETPMGDGLLGPTFSCIIIDQFLRTRHGDRYFYTHLNQPKPVTNEQLREIQKVTLAAIFCENSGIQKIQKNAFKTINDENVLVQCQDIPKINLEYWKIQ